MDVGVGNMCGKTIALDQAHGKELMVGKPFLSVVAMIIKPLLIPR